jgi:peptidoglycan-associated lipoprotein
MLRRLLLAGLVLPLAFAACSKKPPPTTPDAVPLGTTVRDTAGDGARRAAEQARADSIGSEATARARAILQEVVLFDYDEATLRSDAEAALMRKVPILRANPNVRVRIEGHADERGSVEYNLALGQRRAAAAREFLAGFGIAGDRFMLQSFGEDRPAATGSNEEAWARNRRAEFVITAGGDVIVLPGG